MDHFSNADDDDHRWIIRNRTSVEDENERTREELLLDFCDHWKCRNKKKNKKMRESIYVLFLSFFSPLFDPFLIYWSIYIPPLTLAKLYWPGPVQFSCLPLLLVWANVIITSCSSLSLSLSLFFFFFLCVCVYVRPNDDDYRFKSRVSYCTHKQSGIVSSQENVVIFSSLFFFNCNFV